MIFVMILLFENFIYSLTNLNGKSCITNNCQKQHTTHEPLCDSVSKPQPVPQTQPDTPSGFKPHPFTLSLIIFQKISSNLH